MKRLFTIMRKEVLHMLRDPRTLGLIMLLPAILLILLGYGISGDDLDSGMVVVDFSKSDESRAFINKFTANRDFKLLSEADSYRELKALIDQDYADVGIIIPEDFSRKVRTNEPVEIQAFVDGSANPTDSMTIQLKLAAISQMTSQELLVQRIEKSGATYKLELPIIDNVKMLYNPTGNRQLYMIPGLIPILLQVQTLLLSALAIVREREQGTMEQLIVTPIKAWELMLGKIIPYLVVCIANLYVMLWLSDLLFGVTVAGNYWDLIRLSVIFIVGSLGMGVLISNISQSQMQAVYLATFVVLIPAIILTGLLLSRNNMPALTYWYSELLPMTHYLEITRGIIIRGADAASLLYSSTLPMVGLSIVYFIASIFAFRKRI